LEAIGRFVEASEEIRFESENRQQVYGWVEQVLVEQPYAQRGKAARGQVRPTVYRRRSFPRRYTRADIELLASVDEARQTLS